MTKQQLVEECEKLGLAVSDKHIRNMQTLSNHLDSMQQDPQSQPQQTADPFK